MSSPPLKKTRRGLRSPLNSIRRKILTALRIAGLSPLLEAVLDHNILVVRPREATTIRYGYPLTKSSRGSQPHDYAPPVEVTTTLQHCHWALSQEFFLSTDYELPTMLQATVAIQSRLTPAELNWIREHNTKSISSWIAHKLPASHKTSPAAAHWNVNHISELVNLTHYVDTTLCENLAEGFPLLGQIPSGGVFPPATKPRVAKFAADDLSCSTVSLSKVASYLLRTPVEQRLQDAVISDVYNEIKLGRATGPYDLHDLPASITYASPLFAIDQTDKIRLISNYSFAAGGKRFNDAVTTSHKVEMPRLPHLARLLSSMPQTTADMIHVARLDHLSAYRQLPLLPCDAVKAAGMFVDKNGVPKVFIPLVCPFGAVASDSNYLRVGELHCHLIRCLGFCNLFSYMDDYFPVEYAACSNSCLEFFYFVHNLSGAIIKHSKTIPPACETTLLGLRINLRDRKCLVTLTPERQDRILSQLRDATHDITLVNSKLAGRLAFCCEALFGRLGRAPCRTLIRHSIGKPVPAVSLLAALRTLMCLLTTHRFSRDLLLELRLTSSTAPFICYADASTTFGLGFYAPQQHNLPCLSGSLQFTSSEVSINVLELLAAASTLESLHAWFENRPVILFSDSSTCRSLFHHGSSSSPILNSMVGHFWSRLVDLHVYTVFIAYVKSITNPADVPSRGGEVLHSITTPFKLPPWWQGSLLHQW